MAVLDQEIEFYNKDDVNIKYDINYYKSEKQQDINLLPIPAYDMFPIEVYRLHRFANCDNNDFVMPMITSRGCPYKCNFCYHNNDKIQYRDINNIIYEIEYLQKRYGITYIYFQDELFMSSRKRSKDLSEAFINAVEIGKLNKFKWSCMGRLNFADEDLLKLMKKAGCVFINYGIEQFDDKALEAMNKKLTCVQIEKGIQNTLNVGISPGFNMIWGNLCLDYKLRASLHSESHVSTGIGYYNLYQQFDDDKDQVNTAGFTIGVITNRFGTKIISQFEVRWHLLFKPEPNPQVLTVKFGLVF